MGNKYDCFGHLRYLSLNIIIFLVWWSVYVAILFHSCVLRTSCSSSGLMTSFVQLATDGSTKWFQTLHGWSRRSSSRSTGLITWLTTHFRKIIHNFSLIAHIYSADALWTGGGWLCIRQERLLLTDMGSGQCRYADASGAGKDVYEFVGQRNPLTLSD